MDCQSRSSGAVGRSSVLLLSGGIDSTALAAIERPALCLAIDYGQRPAEAELRAAERISNILGIAYRQLKVELGSLGGGLLKDEHPVPGAPTPEWWPFRNQLLITAAASVALDCGLDSVTIGTVAEDAARHADGTSEFHSLLDRLMSIQEGGIRLRCPAIGETSAELLMRSGLGENVVGWTVSCHRSCLPCGECPGCYKRTIVLRQVGLLQPCSVKARKQP